MKVLVLGSGGREHAIAYKCAESSKVEKVYVAPGNGGTAIENKCENVNISKIDEFVAFAKKEAIDLTIVGPEVYLVEGVVDTFKKEGLKIFGPGKIGAQLEGSKSFSKDFMKKYNVKTAAYEVFTEVEPAIEYLKTKSIPVNNTIAILSNIDNLNLTKFFLAFCLDFTLCSLSFSYSFSLCTSIALCFKALLPLIMYSSFSTNIFIPP